MNRRELLKMIATLTGGAVIGGEFFLAGCNNPDKGVTLAFTADDTAFLNEVAETILPKTQSAGAKEAKVGEFMTRYVTDCYTHTDQEAFHKGMDKINEACQKQHGHDFMKATPEQRTALLTVIDKERAEYQKNRKGEEPPHYFQYIKQLTIMGYFTSKEGRNTATRYEPAPGKYIGDYDYKKGDKIITNLD